MLFITRQVEFCAAHTIANPAWSAEENLRVFGPCAHPAGHGHNYVLEVTVRGPVDPATGMVMNLRDLKNIVEEQVVKKCDHKNLNVDPDFLEGVIPTSENVARRIFEVIDAKLPSGRLYRVRLYESARNYVDYYGGRAP